MCCGRAAQGSEKRSSTVSCAHALSHCTARRARRLDSMPHTAWPCRRHCAATPSRHPVPRQAEVWRERHRRRRKPALSPPLAPEAAPAHLPGPPPQGAARRAPCANRGPGGALRGRPGHSGRAAGVVSGMPIKSHNMTTLNLPQRSCSFWGA